MNVFRSRYPESAYGGFTTVDGTVEFYSRVRSLLRPTDVVVDFGCGRGAQEDDPIEFRRRLRILKGCAKEVIGLDVDPVSRDNAFIDRFVLLSSTGEWGLQAGSVDIVVCDFVLEHLEFPETFFMEARRVLRVGGLICARTPNKWGYVAILARLIPESLKGAVLQKAQRGRQPQDVFPTFYSCNTASEIRRQLKRNGFDGCVLAVEGEPTYFDFSSGLFYIMSFVNPLLPPLFRNALLVFARRVR
jgi:SAM-dependent methyltransferase